MNLKMSVNVCSVVSLNEFFLSPLIEIVVTLVERYREGFLLILTVCFDGDFSKANVKYTTVVFFFELSKTHSL